MKNLFNIISFIFLFLGVGAASFGQVTYTTNGTCNPNQANYFGTATCWTRTGTCNTSNTPPASGTVACPVTIVINHEINLVNFTVGNNVTLQINTGGKLNISGTLSQLAEGSGSIRVNGGEIQAGSLVLNSGKNSPKTRLNIDIRNGGAFNVSGLMEINNDAELVIDGDGQASSILNVNSFNFGQRSKVDILIGGGLIVKQDVDYRGNNSSINIYGFFRTEGSVLITGGSGNQLNAFGNANVIIEGNLDVRGTSDITFGGTSETDIGGDILISGNSKVIATEQAKVFVCGTFPTPCDGNNCSTQEKVEGTFSDSCRLLPVEFVYVKTVYLKEIKTSKITWATAKEWESSHFEIERAIKGVEFEKIGEVNSAGWSDALIEYEFEDKQLPLSGGTILYRLKQVDLNGTYVYSDVMSVRASGIEFTSGVWRAYPNPTNGNQLRISLLERSQYEEEKITFRLVHPSAQSQVMAVASEEEMNAALAQMVGRIPKGVFVVEIQWGQKVEHIKVLKQ
jgi:hypothetical protein